MTVGSFDMLNVPGPQGKPVTNPQVDRLTKVFGVQVAATPGNPLMEIPTQEVARRKQAFPSTWNLLDLHPVVIQVPKRQSARHISARDCLGAWLLRRLSLERQAAYIA